MDVFEIILGTYESFVIGVKCRFKSQQSKDLELVQSFNDHVHQASIRSVSCSSKYMASSSTDETIEIYNMIRRCHIHTILQHSGTVTSLAFTPDESHLISTSEDGSIAMFETGTWKLKKLWDKAHKGSAVSFLAVHPSGKLALSVGKDKTLRTWNLVKGRPAYTTNQSSMSAYYFFDNIIWSPAGQYYGLPLNTKLMVFNVETAGIACTIEDNHKIHGVTFITEHLVCYGLENGTLKCYDIIHKKSVWEIKIGESRVKCVIKVDNRLVTALSDGHVTVWELNDNKKPIESCSLFLDCRITCICNNSLRKSKTVKDESDEEAVEVKDDTIIGISIPNKTHNIKSKLPMNDVHNNKRKLPVNGVKSNKLKSIKKKKSLSNNWKVSEENV